jgi:hypothetical protein
VPAEPAHAHSLFGEPWWLDAVAPGAWGEVVLRNGNEVLARHPYVTRSRAGVGMLTHPPLTPALGPWIAPSGGGYARRLATEHRRMEELIALLPPFDIYRQQFAPEVTNALPFQWAGFDAEVRYTYRLDDLSDLDRAWAACRQNVRANVRKARAVMDVRDDLGLDTLLRLTVTTLRRRQAPVAFTRSMMQRIDAAAAARGARRMLFAVDAHDRVHAALYLVWDARTAYYLMGGTDHDLGAGGAMSLLMWEAIRFASGVASAFDFEGSMVRPIERFFRSFGARQVPCLYVKKSNRKGRTTMTLFEGAKRVGDRISRR